MSLLVSKTPIFPDKHLPNEKKKTTNINVSDVAALGSEQKQWPI